nr:beta-lactamase family protein [Actinomycetota bacterium]
MSANTTGTAALGDVLQRHAAPLVADGDTVGVILGGIRGEESSLVCLGHTARRAGEPMGPDVAHEVGSLSKTFTGLLLADMVTRGEVDYDDPVVAHLPGHAAPSGEAGRRITLLGLATHTAGLPRTPSRVYLTMLRTGWRDPYAHYTVDQLYRTTARLRPGTAGRFRYSTLGYGLLGQALANATGTPYPRLLTERVLNPLGLSGAAAELTPDVVARSATGHR